MQQKLQILKAELSAELDHILNYWINNSVDVHEGGFYGKIGSDNKVHPDALKGSVLNARILWSFSSAYNLTGNQEYLLIANRAYKYITAHFIDPEFGGVYWTVDHAGRKLDTKKQVYACAFTIYALSEYYKASGLKESLNEAINLFHILVDKSFDIQRTGYFEAFGRDWQPMDDLRLSAKDANEKKTMNTHLHVLEAYTTLYRIWPDETLRTQILLLLGNFLDHFIDAGTGHLRLFFDEDWNCRSTLISYGHDIEAAWLLQEAAAVLNEPLIIDKLKTLAIKISEATIPGCDDDGGLWYEYEPVNDHLIREKHWWVQAEAMVGFFNTWQITEDEKYLDLVIKNWSFIKERIIDRLNGEWFWGITSAGHVMPGEDKAGLWKCPYHNSRACMQIIERITDKL